MKTDDNETLQQVIAQFEDTIADNSKIRDGLDDAEALPFVDWGVAYAHDLARQMAASEETAPDEEQVGQQAYALTRLMSRLNWVVTYRHKKDPAWLTKTFQMINKLSQDLQGAEAPAMSDDDIAAWIEAHDGQSNADLLQGLMAHYAPPTPDTPEAEPTPATPDTQDEGEQEMPFATFPGILFGGPPDTDQPDAPDDDTASCDDSTLV